MSSIGLAMNVFGLCVFYRMKKKQLFHQLIFTLAIMDSFVLVFEIFKAVFRGLNIHNEITTLLYPYFIHPFFNICICCSIYLTISVSHERYTTLKDPIRLTNTRDRRRKRKFLIYFVSTLTFSVLSNITRFFELSFICPKKKLALFLCASFH